MPKVMERPAKAGITYSLRLNSDIKTQSEDLYRSLGMSHRMLMTQPDGIWTAKDRSGKLDMWEKPDLGKIIEKIKAEKAKTEIAKG